MPIVLKSGSLNLLEPSGPVQACNGIALPFTHMRDRDDPVFEARQGLEMFLFSKSSVLAEKLTKLPTQWVAGFFFGDKAVGAVKLSTYF